MSNTSLFENSFDKTRFSDYRGLIDQLLEEINISEDNLKNNLEMIRKDFPNLTDHSLEHSKMLWNYAALIVGDSFTLNPLESYILHICFLIHDAGMCFSILDNKADIEATDIYKDFVALNQSMVDVEKEALFYSVRKLHGEFALIIPKSVLPSGKMVINDENLRDEFSELVGKISKSHSMDISYIDNELFLYTSPKYVDLPIDCRRLAYILRTADAAHIDNLRTPLFKREIKEKIKGTSQDHWIFQKKMGFPRVETGMLVYSSIASFSPEEKKAWWLCFDALSLLNEELKKADLFFSERDEKGFSAKGVKAIDNPLLLGTSYIRTKGWQSVDTKIKVSRPNLLAANIGGRRLYTHSYLAIRELIQNSIDAINLRQIRQQSFLGKIVVELKKESSDWYLLIQDNGIGMSRNIIINHLLDFGKSYWHSYDFYDDYLGIAQKQFRAIGKFGIGFYSAFMLGECIRIYSSKFGDELNFQNILSFDNGLIENPSLILRENKAIERDYGTTVKIRLSSDPYKEGGFINEASRSDFLFELVKFLIPDPAHPIEVIDPGSTRTIPAKGLSSIETLTFNSFIDKVYFAKKNGYNSFEINELKKINRRLLPVYQDERKIGQLAAIPTINRKTAQSTGVVISNGIRVADLPGNLAGYIEVSEVTNLNRNEFNSDISFESIYDWSSRYIDYLSEQKNFTNTLDEELNREIKSIQFSLGILDENEFLFVYVDTEEDIRSFLTKDSLRMFVRNSTEFCHYQLMDTFHDNFHYKGIFDAIRPFTLNGIIRDDDKGKLVSISSLIEDLIKDEWGEFVKENNQGFHDFPHLVGISYPYFTKILYKREA